MAAESRKLEERAAFWIRADPCGQVVQNLRRLVLYDGSGEQRPISMTGDGQARPPAQAEPVSANPQATLHHRVQHMAVISHCGLLEQQSIRTVSNYARSGLWVSALMFLLLPDPWHVLLDIARALVVAMFIGRWSRVSPSEPTGAGRRVSRLQKTPNPQARAPGCPCQGEPNQASMARAPALFVLRPPIPGDRPVWA